MLPKFVCDECFKEDGRVYNGILTSLNRCARCHMTYYCSKQCQALAWQKHHELCHPIEEIARHNQFDDLFEQEEVWGYDGPHAMFLPGHSTVSHSHHTQHEEINGDSDTQAHTNDIDHHNKANSSQQSGHQGEKLGDSSSKAGLASNDEMPDLIHENIGKPNEEITIISNHHSSNHHQSMGMFCFSCFQVFDGGDHPIIPGLERISKAAKAIKLATYFEDDDDDKIEQLDIARKELKIAVELNPDHAGVPLMLSEALFVEGNYEQAIQLVDHLFNKLTDMPVMLRTLLWLQYGKCYLELEDYSSALKNFAQALSILEDSDTNNRVIALLGCARSLYHLEKYDESIQAGVNAAALNRHHIGVYTYIAKSYEMMDNIELALAWTNQALKYETPWDINNVENIRVMQDSYMSMLSRGKAADDSKISDDAIDVDPIKSIEAPYEVSTDIVNTEDKSNSNMTNIRDEDSKNIAETEAPVQPMCCAIS